MNAFGIEKIGVIGAGQMGAGIAQVLATSGLKVTVVDQNPSQLEKATAGITRSCQKLESKGVLTKEQSESSKKIQFSQTYSELNESDLIIEAIVENEQIKLDLFKEIDKIAKPECIFASNTSSLPITRLASSTSRPAKFIGMHFMNPVPLMKLVEVIDGLATSEETSERICKLANFLGKQISRSKDYPGFVVNRILMPMINEAFTALYEGVATAEDIDKGMKLGTNQPMGPLALADFIGLDTCLAIMKVLHNGLGDSKYRPSPLLQQYVDAGWYGKKSARGVYSYG